MSKINKSILINLSLVACWGILGCSSLPKKSADLTYADLEVKNFDPPDLAQKIDRKAMQRDLDILIFALERGYIVSRYKTPLNLDLAPFKKLESELPDSSTVSKFGDRIGNLLWHVDDGHLFVHDPAGGMLSSLRKADERKPTMGENLLEDKCNQNKRTYGYEVFSRKNRKIPVFSICDSLPAPDDPLWDGFDDTLIKLPKKGIMVIDLRHVKGGSDVRGFQLASALMGVEVKSSKGEKFEATGTSAETTQLGLNQILESENRYKVKGQSVPKSYRERESELRAKLQSSNGSVQVPEIERDDIGPAPKLSKNGFQGQIYVLTDASCGSSCESSLEALLWHPHLKTVGENTRGLVHFTNQGYLELPKSRLSVSIPTKYNEYDVFIEKIGHKPNIEVPRDQDAFKWLVENELQ